MDKRKAKICSVLLGIVMYAILIGTYLIKSEYGFSLYDVFSPSIIGIWMYEKIRQFYNWLIK